MSAFRDPVGPQPGRVYWRRRLVVLLGLVVVVGVVLLIVFRPTDQPVPASSETSAPPAAEEQPGAEAPPAGPAPCTAEQILLTAVTDQDSYEPDVEPQLSWTLANTGAAPCTLNVGTSQQVFTITSGSEQIWTSSDCQADPSDYPLTLEPGADPVSSVSIPWNRTRSAPDTCDAERDPVSAGGASYHLGVSVGGFTSDGTKQFLLN